MKPIVKSAVLSLGILFILSSITLATAPPPPSARQLYLKASGYINKSNYVNALEVFIELVEKYPQSTLAPFSQYQIAAIYIDNLKYIEQGIKELNKFLSLYPSDSLTPKVYYKLVKILYELQNYTEALSTADEALKKTDPHSIDHLNISYFVPACLYQSGKSDFNGGKYSESMEGFRRILKEYPKSSYVKDAVLFSAHCYHLLKKRENAGRLYHYYLVKYGKNDLESRDYFYIGQNFRILGQKREAFDYLKSALIKDGSFSNKIKTEMGYCLRTFFCASPPGPIVQIAANSQDIWILRSADSPRFLNSLSRFNKPENKWSVYNYEDGYVPSSLTSMVVDESNVYLGTYENGLVRFNFKDNLWTNYTTEDGLTENSALSLIKDGETLWIGGKKYLTRCNLESRTFKTVNIPTALKEIRCLAADKKYLWITGGWYDNPPLFKIDKKTEDVLIIPNEEFNARQINTIAVDEKELWLGTNNGAKRYDFKTQKWENIKAEYLEEGQHHQITCIIIQDPLVYLGSDMCTACYSRLDGKINKYYGKHYGLQAGQHLVTDGENIILGRYGTVGRLNTKTGAFTEDIQTFQLAGNYVQDLLINKKYVWVASGRSGLSRYNKINSKWDHFTEKEGLPNNSTVSLVSAKNKIFVGIDRFGTITFNSDFKNLLPFQQNQENKGELIPFLSDKEVLWFQSLKSAGCTCCSTYFGLKGYDFYSGEWTSLSEENGLLHNRIYSVVANDKFLWIGTAKGLNRYDKKTKKLETLIKTDNPVFTSLPNGKELWLYIYRGGLVKYDTETKEGELLLGDSVLTETHFYRVSSSLPDIKVDYIKSVQKDKNYIWLSTNKGLLIYDKKNKKWMPFPDDEFLRWTGSWSMKFDGEYIWLGNSYGLIKLDKKLLFKYNTLFPPK